MVTIGDLRRNYRDLPRESLLILSKILKVDRSHVYAYEEEEITREQAEEFHRLMEKVQRGYPIQYILGEKEFMGLRLFVNEKVLIPRFDTEVLVEYIVDYIKINFKNQNVRVLDMCTGSGAIGLSIAYYCKNALVLGLDISAEAIELANINKNSLNLSNISFQEGDLFAPLDGREKFDIIVSNPPYIPRADIEGLARGVRDFEPRMALDGGLDGLDFYRTITRDSRKYLGDRGLLIYEIAYNQGGDLRKIMAQENFRDFSTLRDSQGHERAALGFYRL
ncbi:MAG: peptide chain release factor N(5)-glutamine methyltransferase [Tissierellaceae bacterium]